VRYSLAPAAACILALALSCAPVREDYAPPEDVVVLAVRTAVELPWNDFRWAELTTDQTGMIPSPDEGVGPWEIADTYVPPGEYAVSAREPSGCLASLESTGWLEAGVRYEWTIMAAHVLCDGER
jgi:hypothetical protein